MADLVGHTLGVYSIVDKLGAGAMGTVYKGYHATMERYVAIKVLPLHLAQDGAFRARFLREARTIARLEHRYILPIYDFGEDNGIYYFVMRYVDGGTLGDLLKRHSLTVAQAVQFVGQVGEALAHAHKQGVIHRDIKPANVLIAPDGNVFLSDFGIAKVFEETLQLTGEGFAVGTPTYMAPEQAQGHRVDGRTDIYALGVLLYQLATGEVPFVAESAFSMALMHVNALPRPPRQLNPGISEALERVILRAMEKDPANRFQTVEDMVTALHTAVAESGARAGSVLLPETYVAHTPHSLSSRHHAPVRSPVQASTVLATSPQRATPPLATKTSARRRLLFIAAFLSILVVGTAILLFVLRIGEPVSISLTATSSVASLITSAPTILSPTVGLIPSSTPLISSTNIAVPAAPSPAGQIAYVSNHDGISDIYVANADGSHSQQLTKDSRNNKFPKWSPNGQSIVFESDRNGSWDIYIMNADGTGQRSLTSDPAAEETPAWSPDGQLITFASSRDGNYEIYSMHSDGTNQVRLTNTAADDIGPSWSPDGQYIAFYSLRDGNPEIYVMNSDGTNQIRLTTNPAVDGSPAWSPDGQSIAFDSNRDGNSEIYVMRRDGTNQHNLTTQAADDHVPTWSPDGRYIAFWSTRADHHDIYIMNADGSAQHPLSVITGENDWPAWSPIIATEPLAATASAVQTSVSTMVPEAFVLSFDVYAERAWQDTGVHIKAGDKIEITYQAGTWTENANDTPRTGPEGIKPAADYDCGMPMSHKVTGTNALIARVGENTPFEVGDHFAGASSSDGILSLRLNDCDERLTDNTGIISVEIKISR